MVHQSQHTLDQHTDHRLDGIDADRPFTEKASRQARPGPQLDELIRFVRDGDVAPSMDRLARNLEDLRRIVRAFTDKASSSSSSRKPSSSSATTRR